MTESMILLECKLHVFSRFSVSRQQFEYVTCGGNIYCAMPKHHLIYALTT